MRVFGVLALMGHLADLLDLVRRALRLRRPGCGSAWKFLLVVLCVALLRLSCCVVLLLFCVSTCGRADVRACGRMRCVDVRGVRTYGVWMHGCMGCIGVWVHRRMDVSTHGCMDVLMRRRTDSAGRGPALALALALALVALAEATLA